MSIELKLDSTEKENNNNTNNDKNNKNENKWKELLYELYYEIKSEILSQKIEIEEDEYQDNIKSITIPKLVKYIHDSIQILINKKIEDSKIEQKKKDENYYNILNNKNYNIVLNKDEKLQYENIIKKLEAKERILTKINFQNQLQKDAMENKIGEYMDMEEEFEEMKTKLKYEDGRFLNNDRKDNEIIIIRGENSNLKKCIKKLEQQIKNLEKEIEQKNNTINKYENDIKQLKIKFEEVQKQNEILNAQSINININNVTGTNKNNLIQNNNLNSTSSKYIFNCNNELNNCYNKEEIISGKTSKNVDNKNKYFPYQKIKTKILNNKSNNAEKISNTHIESSEKTKTDFINKYFTGNKMVKNNMHMNNSCVKINNYHLRNNNMKSNNNSYIPFFNRNMNYNLMKKIISSGGNSSRSSSTKIKGNPMGI